MLRCFQAETCVLSCHPNIFEKLSSYVCSCQCFMLQPQLLMKTMKKTTSLSHQIPNLYLEQDNGTKPFWSTCKGFNNVNGPPHNWQRIGPVLVSVTQGLNAKRCLIAAQHTRQSPTVTATHLQRGTSTASGQRPQPRAVPL